MRRVARYCLAALLAASALVACSHSAAAAGQDLRGIIEQQIRDHVRESYGELAGQNFSDEDLDRFTRDHTTDQIVERLKNDKNFLAAVEKVRAMSAGDRSAYLRRCRLPLRQTWAQLGAITPRGTTEAGQKAEVAIANAIVDWAESLLARPPQK
ncbi:MAG: hypothetical protein WA891_02410 [Acidobacteriaceae bacterium]